MYDSNIEQIGLSNSQLEIIELPNRGKFLYSKIGNILKAKSNFTLLLYIPFLGIGEWYFKYV